MSPSVYKRTFFFPAPRKKQKKAFKLLKINGVYFRRFRMVPRTRQHGFGCHALALGQQETDCLMENHAKDYSVLLI